MPITFWLVLFWCFGVTFLLLGCWLYSYFCWHLEEQFFFPTKQWVFSAVVQIHCYTKEFKANIARDQSQGHGCSRPRIFEASELCCRVVLDLRTIFGDLIAVIAALAFSTENKFSSLRHCRQVTQLLTL